VAPVPWRAQDAEKALEGKSVSENLAVKTEVFGALDRITKAETILASNTSSISITNRDTRNRWHAVAILIK
jgi:3-hydroxyacyl-CoA dehydrogenase